MTRTKVKGTKFKAASSPEQEPDFYTMPPVTITPINTSDEEMSHDDGSSSHPSSSAMGSSMPQQYSVQIQQQQSFEPLPIQFLQNPQMSMPIQPPMMMMPPLSSSSSSYAAASPAPVFFSWPSTAETDQVLDEAVDELFLSESTMGAAADVFNDFVHDWDPNSDFAQTLENDKQLGYMLEKLLED
jgi:hypothetical protein